MATTNSYSVLSKIFRQFAQERGHFESQARVLKLLFDEYSISQNAHILDAACGTGDVATTIYSGGYSGVHAIDGSSHMLSQFPVESPKYPVRQVDWLSLPSVFQEWGLFDFVYFLGHSLPHLSTNNLPLVFRSVFEGLRGGGVLAFDVRSWGAKQDGTITQPGREEGVARYLGEVYADEIEYRLFEEVSYSNSLYSLSPTSSGGHAMRETLAYHMYHWKDAMALLEDAGFAREDQKIYDFRKCEWPYLVITAKKV